MTYPGALEACDGKDNNCSGGISALERDEDGDGQRPCEGDCDDFDPNVVQTTDVDADGVTVCDGDCADADPQRYPGNPEVDACDGIDHDCVPDPGEADADGDGALACAGDCRDDLAVVYPGAEEVCDGWDNDCDGMRDDVPHAGVLPTGEVALADVAWATLYGEVAWDRAGTFVTAAGDVNADGYSDLLVGTEVGSLAPNPFRPSRTYLVYGPVCGEASLALEPNGVSGAMLVGLGDSWPVGDVNDDGFDDIYIAGWLFFGPVYGEFTTADADIWLTNFGVWTGRKQVQFGPDLNDDGFGDLIVGDDKGPMTWNEDSQSFDWGPGQVVVFYGPLVPGELDLWNADVTILGESYEATGGSTGWAVTSPGDLNGDGSDDLVIGSWAWPMGGAGNTTQRGRVDVLYGPLGGEIDLSTDADATIIHSTPGMKFGIDVAGVGDIDGDGLPEFAVGTPNYLDGFMRVFGAVQGELDESAAELSFRANGTAWGSNIQRTADLDGTGGPDLVAAAALEDLETGQLVGGVVVYPTSVDAADPFLTVDQSIGATVSVPDFSGDGAPDLIVGLPGWSTGEDALGAVIVVLGTAP